jgi:hypothetical protein
VPLPSGAIDAYEALRSDVLEGRSRPEGLGAVIYHGMWRGLRVLLASAPESNPLMAPIPYPVIAREPALVHLLANMLLRTQSEVMHVY